MMEPPPPPVPPPYYHSTMAKRKGNGCYEVDYFLQDSKSPSVLIADTMQTKISIHI